MSSLTPRYLSPEARTECGATPRSAAARARVAVLVVAAAALALVLAGHDPASAVALVAAIGIVAAEIATRLLGAPAQAASPAA